MFSKISNCNNNLINENGGIFITLEFNTSKNIEDIDEIVKSNVNKELKVIKKLFK